MLLRDCFLLHQDGQVVAAHLAREEIDGSTKSSLNAKKFIAEFCQPLKMAEEWMARKKQQFGSKTVDESTSFRRVETYLFSNRGRVAVLGCIAAKLGSKLEGNGPDSGIEACRIVQKELQKAKNPPPPTEQAASTDGHAPGKDAPENDGHDATADDLVPAGSVAAMDADDESEPEGPGPVEAIIKEKVDKAMDEFVIENQWEKMETILKKLMTAGSSTRLLFILDAPTSRAKIVTAMIDQVGELLQHQVGNPKNHPDVHVLAPCGPRLDLLSGVANRMGASCPSLASFTVQLTHQAGSQKLKRRAAFAQYGVTAATLKAARSIPTSTPALAARLSPGECTRLRCVSSACRLRSAPVTEDEMKAITLDPSAEILMDDKVEMGVEDMQDAEQGGVAADDLTAPDAKRDCVSDLWPFALGKDFYKATVQELLPGLTIHHWIVMATSAHPSPAVAGHEMGAKVYIFHDRVSAHAAGHGHELLRLSFERTIAPTERKNAVKVEKRMRDEDLVFLTIDAPTEQEVLFSDVPPNVEKSAWRAGFDSWPPEDAMEKRMVALVEKDKDDFKVDWERRNGKMCLVTRRSVKENEQICEARALLFSSARKVRKLLEKGANAALLESAVFIKVQGVLREWGRWPNGNLRCVARRSTLSQRPP